MSVDFDPAAYSCKSWDDPTTILTPSRFANKEALEEIHRVMRPGGVFGMIWNIEDCEMQHRRWAILQAALIR